jgi:hypothetical protein
MPDPISFCFVTYKEWVIFFSFWEVIRDFCEKFFHFWISSKKRIFTEMKLLQEPILILKIWHWNCLLTLIESIYKDKNICWVGFSLLTNKYYLESVYKFSLFVIPAKAGTQNVLKRLDSRFHGNDKKRPLRHLWTDTI